MKLKLLASAIAVGLCFNAMAEDTSSTIRGKITGPEGQDAANTKIIILHVPSGTKKTVTTNRNGNFSASGLRVGGPYTIIVDSDVYTDQKFNDVYLQLGKVKRLDTELEQNTNVVTVVGHKLSSSSNQGSSSFFGSQAIKTQSGLTRDIKDVVRANPLVTILPGSDAPITIAGTNPRFNSFTVDGISQNDDFGLNGGGYPTQRSPIPIDALEQVTVDAAPFDAKVSGFSGGLINSVFKSGTNEFHGSAFYEKINDKWAGTPKVDGVKIPVGFKDRTYGFNFNGPIIKDSLFFMVSYENFDSPQTLEWSANPGTGAPGPNQTEATTAEEAEVIRIARDVYGLTEEQIGTSTGSPVEKDEKYVIKLDWNINDQHRASIAYQHDKGNRTRNTTSSSGELRLSSQWYNVTEKLDNITAKVYSDWTANFSTEISLTDKKVANRQVSFGDFADVTVRNLPSGGQIAFGSDQFRHANILDTETTTFKFDGTYLMDDHNIEFGFQLEKLDVQDLFVPTSKGLLVFNSLTDFENRLADTYTYHNGTGNDPFAVGADFQHSKYSFYAQDNWTVNDQLDVTLGLRYETLSTNDQIPFNQNSEDRTGLPNTENLDGRDILLPRLGIKYQYNDDITLRGGIGRFAGGQPNVWISNAFSQNGVNDGFFSTSNITVPTNVITNILPAAFDAIQNAQSDGNVSFTDPNFKLPSDWRYQIAADINFDIPGVGEAGEGITWTTELLYIKKKDSAFWKDASLHDAVVTTAADGRRLIYTDNDFRYDLMLTNSDVDGRSYIFTNALNKAWDNGLSANLSYTHQDITEANPGTSSTARSNYRFSNGINRNVPADQLGRASFEVEHRFVLNLGYNTEIFEGYQTNINMFWERRSGTPLSLTTNFDRSVLTSDINGNVVGLSPEFTSGNYTSYIPTLNDPNVVYTDPALEAELQAAIKQYGLERYEGGYAPKGSSSTPWITNIDLSFIQEIPGLFEGNKGVLTLTMDNVYNFLNSKKGHVIDNRFGTLRLYDVDSINAQGQYVIDRVRNDSNRFNAEQSIWKIKLGVKYTF
ncbi:MAG TPA: TonB-dependent receptor [Aeromonadales bacterium]|nr:TonB-dependent receptor [Aeromonadales bacterium]